MIGKLKYAVKSALGLNLAGNNYTGFRVASGVPEPGTMVLLIFGGIGILSTRQKTT